MVSIIPGILKGAPERTLISKGLGPDPKFFPVSISNFFIWSSISETISFFIFPSLISRLPLTLVEAQANGLKCYVSKEGVPYETKVIDTFEFISLRKTPQEWAKIITSKTHLRDIEAVKVLKESHYDIDFESNRLEKVYSSEIMR